MCDLRWEKEEPVMWSRRCVLKVFIINAVEIFKQGQHNLIYEF